jgi:hypothetical protein
MANPNDDGMRSDGFLSRWARRKQDVLAGKPVADPVTKPSTVPTTLEMQNAPILQENKPIVLVNRTQAATDNIASTDAEKTSELPPPPTLQEAGALTPASDFKPFMASNVSPEVKNAAMKKLFADPHYNVMDMMDTYVDDYSKPDPIPESMLRELVSAKFLRLFERDEEEGGQEGDKDGKPVCAKIQGTEPSGDVPALPAPATQAAEAPLPLGTQPVPTESIPPVAANAAPQPKQTSANPL